MAILNPVSRDGALRRVVLVDFDWSDADLMPELLRHPGISVRLVVGARADDPGIRVAELCGVPRSLEIADLTRETFDCALVGDKSPRRTHLASLLLALGTPLVPPHAFVRNLRGTERRDPPIEAVEHRDAAALDSGLDSMLDRAIPDLTTTAPLPSLAPAEWKIDLHPLPGVTDKLGNERLISLLAHQTNAFAAALYRRHGDHLECVVSTGSDDLLLRALGDLAIRLDTPQVVCKINGTPGKVWGAWPIRTHEHRAVLMAAGLSGREAIDAWERAALELKQAWSQREEGEVSAEARFRNAWLTPAEFRGRVRLAVERHQKDRQRFAIHRVQFTGAPGSVEGFCQRLPDRLRVADCLCLPVPGIVLLLITGPAAQFPHVLRRIEETWAECCREAGQDQPSPLIDERIELGARDDAEVFLAAASGWLSAARS